MMQAKAVNNFYASNSREGEKTLQVRLAGEHDRMPISGISTNAKTFDSQRVKDIYQRYHFA